MNARPHNSNLQRYGKRTQALDGTWHPSIKQARRWDVLCILQKAGVISDLRREVPVILYGRDAPLLTHKGRQMTWRADAIYQEKGETIHEDSKGRATQLYLMKRAVLAAQGITVRET